MTKDTLVRRCKHNVPIRKDDTNTKNNRKRPRATQNIDIFEIILFVLEAQQVRQRNKVELAIQLLETIGGIQCVGQSPLNCHRYN